MLNGLPWWMWLILGLMPYALKQQSHFSNGYTLEVHALFWSMTIDILPKKRTRWALSIGAIQRLRNIIWDALRRLTQQDSDPCDPTS